MPLQNALQCVKKLSLSSLQTSSGVKLKDDPLLPSILILVSAKNNKSLSHVNNINNTVVRMLIDTASSRNFITESLAKKLCLKSMGISPVELQTLNGFIAGVKSVYEVQATSLINDFTYRFHALSVKEICYLILAVI